MAFVPRTLIASDLVLTAAHCLFTDSGARREDEAFTFNAGFRNGRALAQRRIQSSYFLPSYDYHASSGRQQVEMDIALLRLSAPITDGSVQPIRVGGSISRGGAVDLVSYGQMREHVASLEEDCSVIERDSGVMILTCDTIFGSSGAPVMVETPGGHQIVSVVSGGTNYNGEEVTLAAVVDAPIAELLRMAGARDPGRAVAGLAQVRTLSQDDGRSSSGARFVRP